MLPRVSKSSKRAARETIFFFLLVIKELLTFIGIAAIAIGILWIYLFVPGIYFEVIAATLLGIFVTYLLYTAYGPEE